MKRLIVCLTFLFLAVIACDNTSAPQMTSGMLNTTYEAQATQTAQATNTPVPTNTPEPTHTPVEGDRLPATSPTPTRIVPDGIIEVTPCNVAICEVSEAPTLTPAGVVVFEDGTFTPYGPMNVRGCGSMSCLIIGGLEGLKPVKTQGKVYDLYENLWLCQIATTDGIAQTCDRAVLFIQNNGTIFGTYVTGN